MLESWWCGVSNHLSKFLSRSNKIGGYITWQPLGTPTTLTTFSQQPTKKKQTHNTKGGIPKPNRCRRRTLLPTAHLQSSSLAPWESDQRLDGGRFLVGVLHKQIQNPNKRGIHVTIQREILVGSYTDVWEWMIIIPINNSYIVWYQKNTLAKFLSLKMKTVQIHFLFFSTNALSEIFLPRLG